MAMGDMDERVEMLIGAVYTLTAAASIGVGTAEMFGVGLLDVIHTTDVGFILDYATLGSALSLLGVWVLNRPKIGSWELEYQGLALASVALVVWGSYEPGFASDMGIGIQLLLVGISLGGYWTFAHGP